MGERTEKSAPGGIPNEGAMAYLAQGRDALDFAFYERRRADGVAASSQTSTAGSGVLRTGAVHSTNDGTTLLPNKHAVRPSFAPAVFAGHMSSPSFIPRPGKGRQDGAVAASSNKTQIPLLNRSFIPRSLPSTTSTQTDNNTDTNTDFYDIFAARTISRKQPPPSEADLFAAHAAELRVRLERTKSQSPPASPPLPSFEPPASSKPPPPPLRLIATAEGRKKVLQGERGGGLTRVGAGAVARVSIGTGKGKEKRMESRDLKVERYMQEKKRGEDGRVLVELFRRA